MAEIPDHVIHRFIKDHGGRVTKKQIMEALGNSEEEKSVIEEKLRRMVHYRIILVEGDEVKIA